jgi:outer membrane protein assembly factor BamB
MNRLTLTFAISFGVLGGLASAGEWTQFRGANGNSAADGQNLPDRFGPAENVKWKASLPGRGLSCPVVSGGRVYLTSCSGYRHNRLHVLCFDEATGDKLWERQFTSTGNTACHEITSMAANTPVTDGQNVYCLFATGDLAALSKDGTLLWYRSLVGDYPDITNQVGMAASPVLYKNVLLVPMENDGDSFAAGIDVKTGKNLWRTERRRGINWVTPVVIQQGSQAAALFLTNKDVTAYEPETGREIWSLRDKDASQVASPSYVGGMLYMSGKEFLAMKPGKEGSLPEVVWKSGKLQGGYTTPIVYKERAYAVTQAGIINCVEAKEGKALGQLRLPGTKNKFWASPVAADGKLYIVEESGKVFVVSAEDEPKLLQTVEMGETMLATPAIANGALFLRSDQQLWCVGAKK